MDAGKKNNHQDAREEKMVEVMGIEPTTSALRTRKKQNLQGLDFSPVSHFHYYNQGLKANPMILSIPLISIHFPEFSHNFVTFASISRRGHRAYLSAKALGITIQYQ